MEKLKNAIKEQLQLMEKFRLTSEENLVVELLFLAFEGETDSLVDYLNLPVTKTGLRDILISLQSKGVILKSCKIPNAGEKLDIEALQFNENFLKSYRKTSGELGQELFNAYPNEAIIQGQAVPLKNWAKKFKSEEEMFFSYGRAIGWNPIKHKRVLELIQWSKDNDHFSLNMNIGDWITSRMWNSIEDHMSGSNCIIFDTTTAV